MNDAEMVVVVLGALTGVLLGGAVARDIRKMTLGELPFAMFLGALCAYFTYILTGILIGT